MKAKYKRAAAIWTGAGMFSAAFIAPSALLPASDVTPMLVTVGVVVPAGVGFVLLMFVQYVATQEDVRVKRVVEPEAKPKQESQPQGAAR